MARNRVQRGATELELGEHQAEVQEFLDRLAETIVSGDARGTARMWAVPAFVLDDAMARPVDTISEVEQFFAGAKQQYEARGITDTRGDILDLKWLTPRIGMVEVRWPWLAEDGHELGDERSTYLLRRDDSGALRIQGVIMQGASGEA